MIPMIHFSWKPFFVTDFAGFSSPHVLKLSMSAHWASIPEAGAACLFSAIDDLEPSFAALYMAHDYDGMHEHFSECKMKLLDGGCFNVSLLYFVHFGVLAKHLNVLRKPGKQHATQFGTNLVLTDNNCNPTSIQVCPCSSLVSGSKAQTPIGLSPDFIPFWGIQLLWWKCMTCSHPWPWLPWS